MSDGLVGALPWAVSMRETWNSRKNLGTLIARLPATERIPASVAKYTFRRSWNSLRSVDASGEVVANSLSANCSGVCLDVAKLMDENDTAPDVTSGTPDNVLTLAEQVIDD